MRKVILKQRQSPGDILSMTAAIRDLALSHPDLQIDVQSPCPEIFENCPHIRKLDEKDSDVEVFNITYDEINESHWRGLHFTDAFRHDIEKKLGLKIKKTSNLPILWISELEKTWINQVEAEFGWKGPFWVLNAGCKPDNELKFYHRWPEFVMKFNDYFGGTVRLVQVGHSSHIHPQLPGVYSLIGKTDLRQLIRLIYNSHGTIGPLSFQFVAATALQLPHVVIAAGKEGVRWHIQNNGRYIATNGALECCAYDGCWLGGEKGKCKDLMPGGHPRCFSLIEPRMILDAVAMYYKGGMLKAGVR